MSISRTEQRPGQGRGPMGGPFGGGGMGMPVQKAKNFRGTLNRLLGYFKPQAVPLSVVVLAAVLGTVFSTASPYILGLATTKLFEGVTQVAHHVPGAAVDFNYILQILLI